MSGKFTLVYDVPVQKFKQVIQSSKINNKQFKLKYKKYHILLRCDMNCSININEVNKNVK